MNEELSKCDNSAQKKKIIRKHKKTSAIETFNKLSLEAREILSKYHPIIVMIIYNNYANREFRIDYDSYRNIIEENIANGIIDTEFKLDWYSEEPLTRLLKVLEEIDQLIDILSSVDYEILQEQYSMKKSIEVNKLYFWEEVLNVTMYK